MPKEQILFIGGIIVLIGVLLYLFKIFILDSKKAHKILKNKSGFKEINSIPKIVEDFLNLNQGKRTDLTIKKIVQKDNLYILDLLKKSKKSSGGNSISYSTLLIKKVNTNYPYFFIRKKLSKFMEALIRLDKNLILLNVKNKKFNEHFAAYSPNDIVLPDSLITLMNKQENRFPFDDMKTSQNTLFSVSSNGYSIILNRVTKKEDLDSLIKGFGNISFQA